MAREMKKKIVSVLVQNTPNVMTRVSSVLGRRGFNIDTITVSTTHDPNTTRITIVFNVEEQYTEQIILQLEKMEVVKKVNLLTRGNSLYREMLLVKLNIEQKDRDSLLNVVNVYRGSVVDLTASSMIIEMTGSPEKIEGFLELMKEYDVADFCRSGVTAVESNERDERLE